MSGGLDALMTPPDLAVLAEQNDAFRSAPYGLALWRGVALRGRWLITAGLRDIAEDAPQRAARIVAGWTAFEADDPEHVIGFFEIEGARAFWKLDLFDPECGLASPAPTDPASTLRILTMGLAHEY